MKKPPPRPRHARSQAREPALLLFPSGGEPEMKTRPLLTAAIFLLAAAATLARAAAPLDVTYYYLPG